MLEKCPEISLIQVFPIGFAHGKEFFRRLKLRLRIGQRETVVGAHVLADVAAVNPVLEFCRVLSGQVAFVFDGQVRNALARVNVERRLQGTRWAGVQAFGAASTTVGQGLAGRFQSDGQKKVPNEEK